MYVDVGARNDQTEFHVNFTGADNVLGSEALTPVEVLNRNWSGAWVPRQGTHFQLAFLNSSLSHSFSDTLSFQGNAATAGFGSSTPTPTAPPRGPALAGASISGSP
jgi:iron complex outermembrane recepter protein